MRRELLLEVAFEKFAKRGYNLTLSEIAKGAGIKKQSIYNHFESKDELIYETVKMELLGFYAQKAEEFKVFSELTPERALKAMFLSICSYYKDIDKLRFWRWLLLIDSEDLFKRCRELIRRNESKFYNQVTHLLSLEFENFEVSESDINAAVQTFVVMIQGVLDGMLLYHDIFDVNILFENTWQHYWKSIENLKTINNG